MSLKDYVLLRGRQATVGNVTIQVPGERPKTDAEIVDRELLIDEIQAASEDARETVKTAKMLTKGLRADIETTANRRRRGIPEEKGLFENEKAVVVTADGIRRMKAMKRKVAK